MSINKPRIAGQPAIERRSIADQPFLPKSGSPTEQYTDINEAGLPFLQDPLTPEREGQLSFVITADDTSLNRRCEIHVVVDIDGVLTWKQVTPVTTIINKYTGKPFDPIYD